MKINQEFKKSSQQKIVVANFKKCRGTLGADSRCRCVALPYVPEYEDDYVREEGPVRGVVQAANTDPETVKRNEEEAKRKSENEIIRKQAILKRKRKARTLDFVKALFPKENVIKREELYYVCPSRLKEAKKGNNMDDFKKEEEAARIIAKSGHCICLIPEMETRKIGEKHPDSVIDGSRYELKEVNGSRNKVGHRFLKAMGQAGSFVINLKTDGIRSIGDFKSKIFGSAKESFVNGKEVKVSNPISFVIFNGETYEIDVGEIVKSAKKAAKK